MSGFPAGTDPSVQAAALPFAVAALLFVAIHACYVVAASLGHVEWCVPYIEGCTSISRASRTEPVVFIYRAMITSSAVLMIPYWRTTAVLHGLLGAGAHAGLRRTFATLGTIAAVALIVNAAIIGSEIDWVRKLRRVCVTGFFVFSFLAAVLSVASLSRVHGGRPSLHGALRVKQVLVWLMALFAVAHLAAFPYIDALRPYQDAAENAVEWIWVALLCGFFLASAVAWRGARLRPHWTASG